MDAKEQADWKIPPSISNWKNPKGYTIPLDKRLAADGRGLQEVQINDNFARLSEALLVNSSVTLKIASSIWLHKIKDEYIRTAQSAHKAVAAPLVRMMYAPDLVVAYESSER